MDKGTKNFLGVAFLVLAVLGILNQVLSWGVLQYLWQGLIIIGGIWLLAAKE